MLNKNNLGAFDWFRIFASALVIAIHSPEIPFLNSSENLFLTGVSARIAVPFFFAVTGFFTDFSKAENIKKLVAKTAVMYAVSIAVYIPYGSYSANIKQILFDGAFYHLWYFPAVALGAVIVFALKKLPCAAAVGIAFSLYAFGLFGDGYYAFAENIEPLRKTLDALSNVFSFTRNGLFFAPVFLLIGNIIGNNFTDISRKKRLLISIPCFVLSFILLTIERFSLAKYAPSPYGNMFLFLIPCTAFLIIILSSINAKPRPVLRKISTRVYIIHPIFIDLIVRISNGSADAVVFKVIISLSAAAIFEILVSKGKRDRALKKSMEIG